MGIQGLRKREPGATWVGVGLANLKIEAAWLFKEKSLLQKESEWPRASRARVMLYRLLMALMV